MCCPSLLFPSSHVPTLFLFFHFSPPLPVTPTPLPLPTPSFFFPHLSSYFSDHFITLLFSIPSLWPSEFRTLLKHRLHLSKFYSLSNSPPTRLPPSIHLHYTQNISYSLSLVLFCQSSLPLYSLQSIGPSLLLVLTGMFSSDLHGSSPFVWILLFSYVKKNIQVICLVCP